MVTEECAPYQGNTKGFGCSKYKDCPAAARVNKTHWVGGGWGDVSEK